MGTTTTCSMCADTGRYLVSLSPGGPSIVFDERALPFCPACGREAPVIDYHIETYPPVPLSVLRVIGAMVLGLSCACAGLYFAGYAIVTIARFYAQS